MAQGPDDPAGEDERESWLGALLERFLADVASGREPDVRSARTERPELAAEIEESARLAQRIAPRRLERRPALAGYELIAELGRGGMGSVYLARHARLARRVALKLLQTRLALDARSRERFLREARAIARLDHERIVRIYDVGEDEGTPYYTMDLVEGRTLAVVVARMRELGMPPARLTPAHLAAAAECEAELDSSFARCVARIGLDISKALAHAHEQGVVHRDVKPSNLMLRHDGRTQLFDFGLATVSEEQSLTQSGFLGTPQYASPEQVSGSAGVGASSDVYSLGLTLYELATLECPFRAPTNAEVLRRVREEDPRAARALNSALPKDLETILGTAMSKEPARRYSSAAALASDLEAFLDGRPIAARPIGPLGRLVRRVRRDPLPYALVAGLIAAPTALLAQQRAANERIRRARDEAHEALAVAQAHNEFLDDILSSPAPGKHGREVRVTDVLAMAEQRLEERFADRPAVRASLARTIARTYVNLGLVEDALRARDQELEAVRTERGELDAMTLAVAAERCRTQLMSDPVSALEELERVLAPARTRMGRDHPSVVRAELARCAALHLLHRQEEILELCEDLLERWPQSPERELDTWLDLRQTRNVALSELGRADEAVEDQAEVLRERLAVQGEGSIATIESAEQYARLLVEAGRIDEALELLEPYTAVAERSFGEADPRFIEHLHTLAELLVKIGDLDTAALVQGRALELARKHLWGTDWSSAQVARQAAAIAMRRGDHAGAERLLREELEAIRAAPGEHSIEPALIGDLSVLLQSMGRTEEAAELRSLLERAR